MPARQKKRFPQSRPQGRTHKIRSVRKSEKVYSHLQVILICLVIFIFLGWLFFEKVIPTLVFWNDTPRTVVVVGKNPNGDAPLLLVAQLNQSAEASKVIPVSGDAAVEVISGYGIYALRSVYPLVTLDTTEQLAETAVFGHIFGSIVNDVIELTEISEKSLQDKTLFRQIVRESVTKFPISSKTVDSLKVAYALRQGQVHQVSVPNEVKQLLDASVAGRAQFDHNCSVVVVNTTTSAGLAKMFTDRLENNGILVVRSTSETPDVEKTTLAVDAVAAESCQTMLENISIFLPNPPVRAVRDSLEKTYRGKIVVLLGNDSAEAFSK